MRIEGHVFGGIPMGDGHIYYSAYASMVANQGLPRISG
jgi:hypothetical protein